MTFPRTTMQTDMEEEEEEEGEVANAKNTARSEKGLSTPVTPFPNVQ